MSVDQQNMQKWLSNSTGHVKTCSGVQVDGYHRRQEAFLWMPQLWLGLSLAWIMTLSFNNTLKKHHDFLLCCLITSVHLAETGD